MISLIRQIVNRENLLWAWNKAKTLYRPGDIWFNEISVSNFEANLGNELENIKSQLIEGTYRLSPITPVAFPKGADKNGPRTRQTFDIAVRDQVTWLAITNIIGPTLDYRMPFWSYGNRLFISVFYKFNEASKKDEIKFGWYRNSSTHLYRNWNQSWPLYRRHVAITARIMANQKLFLNNPAEFKSEKLEDDKEAEVLEQNALLPEHLQVDYLKHDYWQEKKLSGELYWVGIDLERFYPSIKLESISDNFRKYYPQKYQSVEFEYLMSNLLKFKLNTTGWTQEELTTMHIVSEDGFFNGIPTGLFVAGFLANVAMIDIDAKINLKMSAQRNIAHFRFVDDHVVLADSYEALENWLFDYKKLLCECNTGLCLNIEKTEPEELYKYLDAYEKQEREEDETKLEKLKKEASKETRLDSDYPTPLMTQTLAKVSQIAHTNFNLLDHDEEERFIADLEHLLVTEFPDQELRKDTRISFAASRLSKLAPRMLPDYDKLFEKEKLVKQRLDEKRNLSEVRTLENEVRKLKKEMEISESKSRKHVFNLLLKAIKDNHDKVRLWARLFEFCRRSGENNLQAILELLKSLEKDEKINRLSKGFIYVLIMEILIEQVIQAYRPLATLDKTMQRISHVKQERYKKFFLSVLKNSFLQKLFSIEVDTDKIYIKETVDEFKFFLGSLLYIIEHDRQVCLCRTVKGRNLIDKFDLADWENIDIFISNTNHALGEWTWWLMNKLSSKMTAEPNILWLKACKLISCKTPEDFALISLFPKKIPHEVEKYDLESIIENEGWWYDYKVSLNEGQLNYSNKYLKRLTVKEEKRKKNTGYLTLYDWIDWTNDRIKTADNQIELTNILFDPRFSEWTALEIVKQIAVKYEGFISNIFVKDDDDLNALASDENPVRIHPANYLIPHKWKDDKDDEEGVQVLTWESWWRRTREQKVEIIKPIFDHINDTRYTPTIEDMYNTTNAEMSVIYGLGVILVGLITRNFDFSPFWNLANYQRNVSLIYRKLVDVPVSAQTGIILKSCFSNRNRETRILKIYQKELSLYDDTQNDPDDIFTIMDLIKNIEKAQNILKHYQLTVQGHKPRQLIPVSLVQLSRNYNPYVVTYHD